MPQITSNTKLILELVSLATGTVAGVTAYGVVSSVLGILTGRPGTATRRPLALWMVFFVATTLALLAGSLALFGPEVAPKHSFPTQEANAVRLEVPVNYGMPRSYLYPQSSMSGGSQATIEDAG